MPEGRETFLKRFIEFSALDWIPILLFPKKFPISPRPDEDRESEIWADVSNLTSESLETVIKHLEKLLEDEDARRVGLDSKAYTLLGVTGIASAFILSFAQFLLDLRSA